MRGGLDGSPCGPRTTGDLQGFKTIFIQVVEGVGTAERKGRGSESLVLIGKETNGIHEENDWSRIQRQRR